MRLRGPRVQLRPWRDDDLAPFAQMNADPDVMAFFINPLSRAESDALATRLRAAVERDGIGLLALEVPGIAFAGFVGMGPTPSFAIDVPGIVPGSREIGWRLARPAWGHGYATEAATLVLRYVLDVLRWNQVISFTAQTNLRSQAVMQRIGLTERGRFDHPRIEASNPLRPHVVCTAERAERAGG
jgi:RimJ/RimL family protein N-acetyltransferase